MRKPRTRKQALAGLEAWMQYWIIGSHRAQLQQALAKAEALDVPIDPMHLEHYWCALRQFAEHVKRQITTVKNQQSAK